MAAPGDNYVFYTYEPSMAAAVLFIVLFGLSTSWHVKQMVQNQTWFFSPFVLGGLCASTLPKESCVFFSAMAWADGAAVEMMGYVGRALSAAEAPEYTKNPYIIQSTLLLLGPALYAASMYMILGRLVRHFGAADYALIPPRWLTKFFVLGDVLSFCTQGGGAWSSLPLPLRPSYCGPWRLTPASPPSFQAEACWSWPRRPPMWCGATT